MLSTAVHQLLPILGRRNTCNNNGFVQQLYQFQQNQIRYTNNNSRSSAARSLHSTTTPSPPPAPPTSKRHQSSTFGSDSLGRRLLIGFGIGSLVGGGYTLYKYYSSQGFRGGTGVLLHFPPSIEVNRYQLNQAPALPISRSVRYPGDTSGLKLTLYQYQTCPFCCKVRTLLDYLGVSYDVVEVNPVLRTQLKWSEKYKKVPILIIETGDGEILQLNDSSMIISTLYSFLQSKSHNDNNKVHTSGFGFLHNDSSSDNKIANEEDSVVKLSSIAQYYPTTESYTSDGKTETDILNKYFLMVGEGSTTAGTNSLAQSPSSPKEEILEERKWRQWADSVYVHTLSPNIYRTMSEALDSFRYFDQVGEWEKNFKSWERTLVIYVGAAAMWLIGKRLQKRHHLKNDVRQSLYDESNYWMKCIKEKGTGDFMGGSKPNLADLAVFGVLSSIEGCQAFQELNQHSPIISDWYVKVKGSLQHPEEMKA